MRASYAFRPFHITPLTNPIRCDATPYGKHRSYRFVVFLAADHNGSSAPVVNVVTHTHTPIYAGTRIYIAAAPQRHGKCITTYRPETAAAISAVSVEVARFPLLVMACGRSFYMAQF